MPIAHLVLQIMSKKFCFFLHRGNLYSKIYLKVRLKFAREITDKKWIS